VAAICQHSWLDQRRNASGLCSGMLLLSLQGCIASAHNSDKEKKRKEKKRKEKKRRRGEKNKKQRLLASM